MCRLDTCRNAARATGPNPSKYCSDAHGEQYMRQRVLGREAQNAKTPAKKKRKEERGEGTDNGDDDNQDSQAHLRGGILKPAELKALVSGVDNIGEFKRLGNPVSKMPTTEGKDYKDGVANASPSYTPSEATQLETISQKQAALQNKLEALKAKERFAEIVRGRAKGVLEDMKKRDKSLKDICGYDARLSWSDKEFDDWRSSDEGKLVLETRALGPPSKAGAPVEDADGDMKMTDSEDAGSAEFGAGVCQKKRCERHKQWFKLQIQEVAFEKDECGQEKAKLEKEERGVNERAVLRSLDSKE